MFDILQYPLLNSIFEGQNTAILFTGGDSCKTTMFGDDKEEGLAQSSLSYLF